MFVHALNLSVKSFKRAVLDFDAVTHAELHFDPNEIPTDANALAANANALYRLRLMP